MINVAGRLSLLLVLALALAPLQAGAQVEEACGPSHVSETRHVEGLLKFYAAHARPVLGAERRLANGTAWRVIVDSVTGMAQPRITWMADKEAMRKANRLLEARQACSMVSYYGMAGTYFRLTTEPDIDSSFIVSGYLTQLADKTILSYASSKLVGTFNVSLLPIMGGRPEYRLSGEVLDLERNQVVSSGGCEVPIDEPTGTSGSHLGEFFEACSEADRLAFQALWEKHVTTARAHARARQWPLCQPDPEDDTPRNRFFEVYLAAGGLAVYSGYYWPRYLRRCLELQSADNPVIIPWRELAPFLKPGPWRDELLGQTPR